MFDFLSKEFALYTNLIFGGLFLIFFTGTWLLLHDLKCNLTSSVRGVYLERLRFYYYKIRVRRILSLLLGFALIIAYFFKITMTGLSFLIFILFWLSSLNLMGNARKFIKNK